MISHRHVPPCDGDGALTDSGAIDRWFETHGKKMTAAAKGAESAASGDLGYTYGSYQLAGGTATPATYLRVWTRESSGRWLLVVDVFLPSAR